MSEQTTDRNRWIALYVLCAGVLMIVLDVTVVNVALPSIQDDLGFSQSSLAWVVNAYLISFGGLLLLSGRFGDLIGRKDVFMAGLARLHAGLHPVRRRAEPGDAGRGALHPGHRRRHDVGGRARDDRDDVPGAARPGQGHRRLRLRGLGGRHGRPACRRRADPGDQLALDLLHQHPDRRGHGRAGVATDRARQGDRPERGRRRARRGADHRLADARRLHDRQAGGRRRLGRVHHAPARRRLARAAGRVHRPRGHGSHAADPAADLPLAEPLGREHRPAAARGRDVRPVLHGRALHGARARLRPAPDRLRVPAGHARDGNALASLRRAA